MAWVRGANQYAKGQRAESQNKKFFWRRPLPMYQQELRASFLAIRAAEAQSRERAILEGFLSFAESFMTYFLIAGTPRYRPGELFWRFSAVYAFLHLTARER